jgi:hypothetical protein
MKDSQAYAMQKEMSFDSPTLPPGSEGMEDNKVEWYDEEIERRQALLQ